MRRVNGAAAALTNVTLINFAHSRRKEMQCAVRGPEPGRIVQMSEIGKEWAASAEMQACLERVHLFGIDEADGLLRESHNYRKVG